MGQDDAQPKPARRLDDDICADVEDIIKSVQALQDNSPDESLNAEDEFGKDGVDLRSIIIDLEGLAKAMKDDFDRPAAQKTASRAFSATSASLKQCCKEEHYLPMDGPIKAVLRGFLGWIGAGSLDDKPESELSDAIGLLASAVTVCRHGSQDLPSFQGDLCTAAANALTEQYLKRLRVSNSSYADVAAYAVSPGMKARAKELGKVLQSIAIGSVMCDYADDTNDPMSEREVGRVFDAYAPSYNKSMDELQYSVPKRVEEWSRQARASSSSTGASSCPSTSVSAPVADDKGKAPVIDSNESDVTPWAVVVDLGCGTGIMGRILRGSCLRLVGCDLSAGMVLAASLLGVYHELHVNSCHVLLENLSANSIDVIVAADVIEYIGDVADLFKAVATALRPGGHFIVSSESLETSAKIHNMDYDDIEDGYALLPTERYAHSSEYLKDTVLAAKLAVASMERLPCLRQEGDKSLQGWLCFATK